MNLLFGILCCSTLHFNGCQKISMHFPMIRVRIQDMSDILSLIG